MQNTVKTKESKETDKGKTGRTVQKKCLFTEEQSDRVTDEYGNKKKDHA